MGATSIHVQAVKPGSEIHNFREKELDYVRPELSHLNESWVGDSISHRLESAKQRYLDTVGQKMQAKAAPIREGVIVIKQETTMQELQQFATVCKERFGIEAFQIHIHKDEDFQSMLAPIRQSLEAKEKEYKEAEQALNSNRAEVKTYENMIANSRLATEKTRKGHDLARTEAEEQCIRCSIPSISDNTKEILEKLFQENKLNLENVNAKLNEVQTLSNHISRLQHLKDNHQKACQYDQLHLIFL